MRSVLLKLASGREEPDRKRPGINSLQHRQNASILACKKKQVIREVEAGSQKALRLTLSALKFGAEGWNYRIIYDIKCLKRIKANPSDIKRVFVL